MASMQIKVIYSLIILFGFCSFEPAFATGDGNKRQRVSHLSGMPIPPSAQGLPPVVAPPSTTLAPIEPGLSALLGPVSAPSTLSSSSTGSSPGVLTYIVSVLFRLPDSLSLLISTFLSIVEHEHLREASLGTYRLVRLARQFNLIPRERPRRMPEFFDATIQRNEPVLAPYIVHSQVRVDSIPIVSVEESDSQRSFLMIGGNLPQNIEIARPAYQLPYVGRELRAIHGDGSSTVVDILIDWSSNVSVGEIRTEPSEREIQVEVVKCDNEHLPDGVPYRFDDHGGIEVFGQHGELVRVMSLRGADDYYWGYDMYSLAAVSGSKLYVLACTPDDKGQIAVFEIDMNVHKITKKQSVGRRKSELKPIAVSSSKIVILDIGCTDPYHHSGMHLVVVDRSDFKYREFHFWSKYYAESYGQLLVGDVFIASVSFCENEGGHGTPIEHFLMVVNGANPPWFFRMERFANKFVVEPNQLCALHDDGSRTVFDIRFFAYPALRSGSKPTPSSSTTDSLPPLSPAESLIHDMTTSLSRQIVVARLGEGADLNDSHLIRASILHAGLLVDSLRGRTSRSSREDAELGAFAYLLDRIISHHSGGHSAMEALREAREGIRKLNS